MNPFLPSCELRWYFITAVVTQTETPSLHHHENNPICFSLNPLALQAGGGGVGGREETQELFFSCWLVSVFVGLFPVPGDKNPCSMQFNEGG